MSCSPDHVTPMDKLITVSLSAFAADTLDRHWHGKEHDWVNRYAHGYLLKHCTPDGPLYDPGQIAIEVGVPQPPGYKAPATRRDLVIWPSPGLTCWDAEWRPVHHPVVIIEWKVHRPGRKNRDQPHEREWLRRYTQWQQEYVAYAVEINLGCTPNSLTCHRFHAGIEMNAWLSLSADSDSSAS